MKFSSATLILSALVCALVAQVQLQGGSKQEQRKPNAKPPAKIDLNSADERQLMSLPDITFPIVRKIIANRPYTDTHQLVSKGVITEATYKDIRDLVSVKEAPPRRLTLPGAEVGELYNVPPF